MGCADAAFATLCLCLSLSVCTTKSFLFEVLKHPSVLRDRVPVLIACNKSCRALVRVEAKGLVLDGLAVDCPKCSTADAARFYWRKHGLK